MSMNTEPTTPDEPAPEQTSDAHPQCSPLRSRQALDSLASLGAELLRRGKESQAALEAAWDELMASWGVRGQPVGVQRLRDTLQQEWGTDSHDSSFSRELIALREERRA